MELALSIVGLIVIAAGVVYLVRRANERTTAASPNVGGTGSRNKKTVQQ